MGKIMKNGRSYGGGNCGGGTNVQANPLDSATIELEKILIDQTIYSVVTKAVSDLVNYYTKNQIDGIVDAIKNSRFEVVSSLPTTNIKTNVIYLVPSNSPTTNNTKNEFINTDGTSSGWEQIGNTSIDLSGYITTSDLNSALENIYNINDSVETDISNNDYFPFYDTSANAKRKTLWSNVKSVLKTYFDSIYNAKLTAGTNISISNNTISASMPVLGTIYRSDIYSTTEKIVGCYIDGRPIYQKCVAIGVLNNATSKSVAHGVTNVRRWIKAEAMAYTTNTPTTGFPIPYVTTTNNKNTDNSYIQLTSTDIKINLATDWSAETIDYVVLQYTKTTDAANSYNYANENDYSTSEKIVGTWVNGSRLFQRCVFFTMPTVSQDGIVAQTLVDLSSWGATLYTEVSGMFWKDQDNTVQSVPLGVAFNTSTSLQYGTRAYVNSTRQLIIESNYASFSGRPGIVILKYVKS